MKSCILFTGTGPILVLTNYTSVTDKKFVDILAIKGIKKFIAYELPLDLVKEKYSSLFDAVVNDVTQTDELRVLDYDGHNVFYNFSFAEMGAPVQYEPK